MKQLRFSLKLDNDSEVEFICSEDLMNAGFKFSYLAPIELEEIILKIIRSKPEKMHKTELESDSLEEALLSFKKNHDEINTQKYRFTFEKNE